MYQTLTRRKGLIPQTESLQLGLGEGPNLQREIWPLPLKALSLTITPAVADVTPAK